MNTPIDFRNETYEGLRQKLPRLRREVYAAWVVHGPGTTRQLAARSGIDILTFRPRTTELVQVGLVKCIGGEEGEGVYQAVCETEWECWRRDQVEGQLLLL